MKIKERLQEIKRSESTESAIKGILDSKPEASVNELAKLIGVDKSNISRGLKSLKFKGTGGYYSELPEKRYIQECIDRNVKFAKDLLKPEHRSAVNLGIAAQALLAAESDIIRYTKLLQALKTS